MPSESIISIGAIGCFAAGSGVGGGGDGAGDEVRRPLGAGGWLAVPGTTIGWGFGAAAGAKARICTGEPTGEVFIEFFDVLRDGGCDVGGETGGLDFQSNMFISEPRRLRVSFISSCDASWNVVPSGPGVGVGGSDIVDPVDGLPSAHTTVRQWRGGGTPRNYWFNVGWHWIGLCARLLRPVPERRKERARRAAAVEHALRDELWSVSQG